MTKLNKIGYLASVAALCLSSTHAWSEPVKAPKPGKAPAVASTLKSGRIAVNGVEYYYELHGRGEPLLVLHGGLGSIDMFGR